MATESTPIPVLSFPAILRNPGLNNRYAHLHGPSATGNAYRNQQSQVPVKKKHRDQNEGKRWVRRKDNARFVGNPHIVAASKRDYGIPPPQAQSTFPEPLPAYLPRNIKLPTVPNLPVTDPGSANAGRFSLSLKGMRRDLRRAGGRAQALVGDVESEMVQWLTLGGTLLSPDARAHAEGGPDALATPVGTTGTIFEVSRTPLQLIWRITDDSFARYVVHCCARYHEVVSYSKGTPDNRLTYLLRPNVTRPDRRAPASLETPPITDIDYSSNPDTDDNIDSDFISEHEMESDMELEPKMSKLSVIDESPNPLALVPLPPVEEMIWSHSEDESDIDEFESGSEFGSASVDFLEPRLQSLTLQSGTEPHIPEVQDTSSAEMQQDPDKTLPDIRTNPLHGASPRRREWTSMRSPSSPSRSPARARPPRRRRGAKKLLPTSGLQSGKSFYEYLFM